MTKRRPSPANSAPDTKSQDNDKNDKAEQPASQKIREIYNLRAYRSIEHISAERCQQVQGFSPGCRQLSIELINPFLLYLLGVVGRQVLPYFYDLNTTKMVYSRYLEGRKVMEELRSSAQMIHGWWSSDEIHRLLHHLQPFVPNKPHDQRLTNIEWLQEHFGLWIFLYNVYQTKLHLHDHLFYSMLGLFSISGVYYLSAKILQSHFMERPLRALKPKPSAKITREKAGQFDVLSTLEYLFAQSWVLDTSFSIFGIFLLFTLLPLLESETWPTVLFVINFLLTVMVTNRVFQKMDLNKQRENRKQLAMAISQILRENYFEYIQTEVRSYNGSNHIIEVTRSKGATQSSLHFFSVLLEKCCKGVVIFDESDEIFSLILTEWVDVEAMKAVLENQLTLYKQFSRLAVEINWCGDSSTSTIPLTFTPFDDGEQRISWSVALGKLNDGNKKLLNNIMQALFKKEPVEIEGGEDQLIVRGVSKALDSSRLNARIFRANQSLLQKMRSDEKSIAPKSASTATRWFAQSGQKLERPKRTGPKHAPESDNKLTTVGNEPLTRRQQWERITTQAQALCRQAEETFTSSLVENESQANCFFALVHTENDTPQYICCIVCAKGLKAATQAMTIPARRQEFDELLKASQETQVVPLAKRTSGVTGSGIIRCGTNESDDYKVRCTNGERCGIKTVGVMLTVTIGHERISKPLAMLDPNDCVSHQQYDHKQPSSLRLGL